jgi:cell division transport system permease protein
MMATPPLLARRRRPGATAWLIAAACLIMMLAAAAVLTLGRAARGLEHAVASRLIVQVIEPSRTRRDTLAAAAMAELGARPDITALRQLNDAEIGRLIGPYLGKAGLTDLPIPALIDVDVAPDADMAAIARDLRQLGPITAQPARAGLGPLSGLIATLRGIAFAFAGIAAAATGLIAILAARAAFAGEASTIAILHGLGGTDAQIARAITGQIARDAGIGAGIGIVLTIGAMALLAERITALGAGIGQVGIDWSGWIILALLPLGLVALAAGAAHIALLFRLGRAP